MPSTSTRADIVLQALALAGRSTELKASCNVWLNLWLTHVSSSFRFPELRKIGAQQVLPIGQQTAPLPADFGAGMEKQGMIFGDDRRPLDERQYEDFAANAGFLPTNTGSGRPAFYIVDHEADMFRFNTVSDAAYPFIPVYFKKPDLPPVDSSGDNQTIWFADDLVAVQSLVAMIYQFTGDEREMLQEQRVFRIMNEWKRELVKMGGTSRVIPNPTKFRNVRFGGMFGP